MKRPAESDMRIYAREAYRAAWPGTAFTVAKLSDDAFVARSLDERKRAEARWIEGAPKPAEVVLVDMGQGSAIGSDTGFTFATVTAVRNFKTANGGK